MERLLQVTFLTLSFAFFNCSYSSKNAQAQIEIKPNIDVNIPGLDDLPNNRQQMFLWRCSNEDKEIAVEEKDVDNWQKMLALESWSCQQDLSVIPSESGKFSCTPQEDIGIITVYWLKGEGAKKQMLTWFDELSNNQNMVCYQSRSDEFWD
jgi:hypothetical protein